MGIFTWLVSKLSGYTKKQWSIYILIAIANCFAACVNSLQAPFYPAEAESKGASSIEYGFVFGIFQLAFFLVSPIYGKYMNYIGARSLFLFALVILGCSCFVFGFLDKFEGHVEFISSSFVLRILEAIGGSAMLTSSFTIIAGEFPASVATTFASLETFYGLGLIIGPTLGGALYEVGGFILPFATLGITFICVAAITTCLLPKNISTTEDAQEGYSLLTLLKLPSAMLAGISICVSSNNVGFLNAILEPHLRQFQLSKFQVGLAFMLMGLSYSVSAPLWGKLIDKKCHPKYVTLLGSIFLILAHLMIGPVSLINSPSVLSVTCIGLVAHGIGVGAIQVAGFVLALRESRENGFPDNVHTYSVVSGLWATSLALGLFIGPCVGGYLLDITNYRIASLYTFTASLMIAGYAVVFILCRRIKTKEDALASSPLLGKENGETMAVKYHGSFDPLIVQSRA